MLFETINILLILVIISPLHDNQSKWQPNKFAKLQFGWAFRGGSDIKFVFDWWVLLSSSCEA